MEATSRTWPGGPRKEPTTRSTSELEGARSSLPLGVGGVDIYRLAWLADQGIGAVPGLPHTLKILLEDLLRRAGGRDVADADVAALAAWPAPALAIAFMPGRVLMQDFTGVPAVVDLAAMRSAVARAGADPARVNPHVPVDLIIDHSVQVDLFRSRDAYEANIDWEYRRNAERYALLRWAQQAFANVRVVPPGAGICHQVNLEHLGHVVVTRAGVAFPDTLVGTDSHTTMVNGLGVLGWGVGGIEAEAAMLGQPIFLPQPLVLGIRVVGELPAGTTATDLVLSLTEMLRAHGVVGTFVEFFGDGLSSLSVADRATLSNMCPEYGATSAYFPVDHETLRYLTFTGRGDLVDLVERYTKEQGLFRADGDPDPRFSEVVELDLAAVEPSVAGPKRPQDRVALAEVWGSFVAAFRDRVEPDPRPNDVGRFEEEGGNVDVEVDTDATIQPGAERPMPVDGDLVKHGSVVIAAITSCTNTSNPSVMLAAGLLAKKAVEAGLETRSWVKTSLAPGSRVVTDYLDSAGLTPYLEKLGFALVGYGCTTCIGNSGPLPERIATAVDEGDLNVVAVLSGNRNFEGRIHPQVRASYLASPPLCVAYALAGSVEIDLTSEPLGMGADGPIFLRDIWPTPAEVASSMAAAITEEQFVREYAHIWDGDERWMSLPTPSGPVYAWDPASTYVQEPPFFGEEGARPIEDIEVARVLVRVGDSITTDHISPAGSIKADSPAGRYLQEHGVPPGEFNSYGARRGNHEVMMRGTFANIRLRNELAPGTEGSWTTHFPSGEVLSIFDAAERYRDEGVPLAVLAGKEYGSGSSRDWAAKGPALLGVRFVIAESYERIHRSNLVGMGVLPLQYLAPATAASLGLSGYETFAIRGLTGGIVPGQEVTVEAVAEDGRMISFPATLRVDGAAEVDYLRSGGVLNLVLADMLRA
ncbi:MAG: aconitate hydratase AcnA [Actinobacteria bacterium]|nr:MAG: aconitate hydratase AcnA [Actinomycetota bacterium]